MKLEILIIILIIIVAIWVKYNMEYFSDLDMITFEKLDGSLIKKFKIGSSFSLYDSEIKNLFKDERIIRMIVPSSYNAKIIYKFSDGKGFAKTMDYSEGSYDIREKVDNTIMTQIDINTEPIGNIIQVVPSYWGYNPYGYRRTIYHSGYPRYRRLRRHYNYLPKRVIYKK
jgi:hypothetical protein